MKGLDIELSNGHFDIVSGSVFSAGGGSASLLCYEENDITYVKTDPQSGSLYEGRIVIPKDTETVKISLKRCSASVGEINTGNFKAELVGSSAEFALVTARRIILSSGKSDVVIHAAPIVAAEFKCGFGSTRILLKKSSRGYSFDTVCGAGELTINSMKMKRIYKGGVPGGIPIKVSCGLGTVEIHNN